MSIALNGFITGLSLIIAIGPQNALLLRQGLKRVAVTHVIAVCLISDVFLIVGGTLGVQVPLLQMWTPPRLSCAVPAAYG